MRSGSIGRCCRIFSTTCTCAACTGGMVSPISCCAATAARCRSTSRAAKEKCRSSLFVEFGVGSEPYFQSYDGTTEIGLRLGRLQHECVLHAPLAPIGSIGHGLLCERLWHDAKKTYIK